MYQKWLQAFHAVARAGGFTAAARQLNVGQQTSSSGCVLLTETGPQLTGTGRSGDFGFVQQKPT
jgi:hypothetical protein